MLYRIKDEPIKRLRDLLPQASEEGIAISMHSDADGIAAGVLASYGYKIRKTLFPLTFGGVGGDEAIMLDMMPASEFRGVVIDHHPPGLLPLATIIWGEEPACLIAWELFKDKIPKEHWWKLMVGLMGDGQPELMPNEAWETSKFLLDDYGSFVSSKGTDYYWGTPVWMQLSSGINALARGQWAEKAFSVLKEANVPYDILENPFVREYKERIAREENEIFREVKPIDLGHVLFWKIASGYNVTGILASRLYETRKKTAFVLNANNGAISVRGLLAYYIKERLASLVDLGGHRGYCGGILKPNIEIKEVLEALRRV